MVLLAALLIAGFPALSADLVLEGAGERLVVPGERLEEVIFERDVMGDPGVHFRFNGTDAEDFHQMTSRLIGKELAISVCGEELLRPIVREPIAGGAGLIVVGSTFEALTLVARLKGDAPCP